MPSPEVANLLTHFQGRSAEFTMKPFKGSSNKLGPLGVCGPSPGVAREGTQHGAHILAGKETYPLAP